MKKSIVLFFFILLAVTGVLSACGEGTVTEASGRNATVTRNASFSNTQTAQPTNTPEYQSWEQAKLATQNAAATTIAHYPANCGTDSKFIISDNEEWLAMDCFVEGGLKIIQRDGFVSFTVPYEEIFSDNPNYPANIGSLIPLHWTQDNQYLFFTRADCCWDGISLSAAYYGNLYRFNMQTGMWSIVVPASMDYYSFSPTGRRLAYIQEFKSPLDVNILDLKTGEETTITVANYTEGAFVTWSPDGKKFALTLSFGLDWDRNGNYALLIYDLDISQQIIIIGPSTEYVYPYEWTTDDLLLIRSAVLDSVSGSVAETLKVYDYKIGQFITP